MEKSGAAQHKKTEAKPQTKRKTDQDNNDGTIVGLTT